MNGFGFVQLVARLNGPSLLHRFAISRLGMAARMALRRQFLGASLQANEIGRRLHHTLQRLGRQPAPVPRQMHQPGEQPARRRMAELEAAVGDRGAAAGIAGDRLEDFYLVGIHRQAGAHQIAIAVGVVNPANRRPELKLASPGSWVGSLLPAVRVRPGI